MRETWHPEFPGEDEMTERINGYDTKGREKLLREFGRSVAAMKEFLVARYGADLADQLQRDAHHEYESIIPKIPRIDGGRRSGTFNRFLQITAQELAVYNTMKKVGKGPDEAWELCHDALRLRLAEIPAWKRRLFAWFLFSPVVKKVFARRVRKNEIERMGEFEIAYVDVGGDGFDYGVNYLQCENINFLKKNGAEAFAPYVCMSDIALSDAFGWGLTRTQTLADGCGHCDFRFRQGAPTRVSSKTPGVQKTIERIYAKEAGRIRRKTRETY